MARWYAVQSDLRSQSDYTNNFCTNLLKSDNVLGKLFTHTASPVSQLQETGVQKGVFSAPK